MSDKKNSDHLSIPSSKHGPLLLVGSDVRKLVFDGYPAHNVLGCDLRQEFIDSGYDLYNDKESSQIQFFTSDIFDIPVKLADTPSLVDVSNVTTLEQLRGPITHFYTGALFHLFDESTQYELGRRVAILVKLQPGTIIFGRHQGLAQEGYIDDHMGRCALCQSFSPICSTPDYHFDNINH